MSLIGKLSFRQNTQELVTEMIQLALPFERDLCMRVVPVLQVPPNHLSAVLAISTLQNEPEGLELTEISRRDAATTVASIFQSHQISPTVKKPVI
jgi:hypothetical protein